MPTFAPTVSSIVEAIQLSLSPVFMLAGIGALLNMLVGRLSRVVDRARVLETLHPRSSGPEHDRHVWELRLLNRRMNVINAALMLVTLSAVMTCLVVGLLFVAELVHLRIGRYLAIAFILAMLLLIFGLACFMQEVRLSVRSIRIRPELLQKLR